MARSQAYAWLFITKFRLRCFYGLIILINLNCIIITFGISEKSSLNKTKVLSNTKNEIRKNNTLLEEVKNNKTPTPYIIQKKSQL